MKSQESEGREEERNTGTENNTTRKENTIQDLLRLTGGLRTGCQ